MVPFLLRDSKLGMIGFAFILPPDLFMTSILTALAALKHTESNVINNITFSQAM